MSALLTSLWQALLCLALLAVGAILAFAVLYFIVYAVKTLVKEVKEK